MKKNPQEHKPCQLKSASAPLPLMVVSGYFFFWIVPVPSSWLIKSPDKVHKNFGEKFGTIFMPSFLLSFGKYVFLNTLGISTKLILYPTPHLLLKQGLTWPGVDNIEQAWPWICSVSASASQVPGLQVFEPCAPVHGIELYSIMEVPSFT